MDVSSCIHHYVITIAQASGQFKNVFDVLFFFFSIFVLLAFKLFENRLLVWRQNQIV
jgi:hypothetical protein